MNRKAAKQFILQNARPIDLAVYKYFFENESNRSVVDELSKYQNQDGGFGHGLELDYWNPNSSPIATNDAIITLFRVGALGQNSKMTNGIVQYLESLDSFDKEKNVGCLPSTATKIIRMQYGGKRMMTESMDLILLSL